MDDKKLKEVIKAFSDVDDAFKQFNSVMSTGPSSYYLEKLMGYYEGCMKAAKFQVGDRVELKEDYAGHGWEGQRHFLIKGAKATIHDVDYHEGKYFYDIMFDDESWIGYDKKINPVKDKHTFCFRQKALKKLK